MKSQEYPMQSDYFQLLSFVFVQIGFGFEKMWVRLSPFDAILYIKFAATELITSLQIRNGKNNNREGKYHAQWLFSRERRVYTSSKSPAYVNNLVNSLINQPGGRAKKKEKKVRDSRWSRQLEIKTKPIVAAEPFNCAEKSSPEGERGKGGGGKSGARATRRDRY